MFEKNTGDVTHQDFLVGFAENALDRVDHTHVVTALESQHGKFQLNELQTLLTNNLIELCTEFVAHA